MYGRYGPESGPPASRMTLYPRRLISLPTCTVAGKNCRRLKRGTANALKFEYRAELNLLELAEELAGGTYQPSRVIRFAVDRPKLREIVAADFRDRVVHHYLVERLEQIYEPVFIHDSYACRRGKGVHAALVRRRSVNNLRIRLDRLQRSGVRQDARGLYRFRRADKAWFEQVRSIMASYYGHFKWADTNRLRRSIFQRYPWLNAVMRLNKENMPKLRTQRIAGMLKK